jgi:hypothetical protein
MVGKRQATAILGMAFAVAGGAAWFMQLHIPAVILWGVAGIIMLRINRRPGKRR